MMRENGKDNARGNANERQNSVVTSRFILAHGWFITMRIVTTARRLGPLICTYFLSFAAAEPTEKKKKKKRVEERKRNERVVSGIWIIQPAALVCRAVDNDNRGSPGNDNCSSISFVGRITIIATLITRWWSNTVWLIRKTSLAIRINCNVEERIHRMYPWLRFLFLRIVGIPGRDVWMLITVPLPHVSVPGTDNHDLRLQTLITLYSNISLVLYSFY